MPRRTVTSRSAPPGRAPRDPTNQVSYFGTQTAGAASLIAECIAYGSASTASSNGSTSSTVGSASVTSILHQFADGADEAGNGTGTVGGVCRNITTLRGLEPIATPEEIEAAARQYVRKVSGVQKTSEATAAAFERAVAIVTVATHELLDTLPARKVPPKTEPPLRRIARVRAAD